jgi:hypothetical protein
MTRYLLAALVMHSLLAFVFEATRPERQPTALAGSRIASDRASELFEFARFIEPAFEQPPLRDALEPSDAEPGPGAPGGPKGNAVGSTDDGVAEPSGSAPDGDAMDDALDVLADPGGDPSFQTPARERLGRAHARSRVGVADAARSAGQGRGTGYGRDRRGTGSGGLGETHGSGTPSALSLWGGRESGPVRVEVYDNGIEILREFRLKPARRCIREIVEAGIPKCTEWEPPHYRLPLPEASTGPAGQARSERVGGASRTLRANRRVLDSIPPGLVRFSGRFFTEASGLRSFRIQSENAALLRIDGKDVIHHRLRVWDAETGAPTLTFRPQVPSMSEHTLSLDEGSHTFEVLYWNVPWPRSVDPPQANYRIGLELTHRAEGGEWRPLP